MLRGLGVEKVGMQLQVMLRPSDPELMALQPPHEGATFTEFGFLAGSASTPPIVGASEGNFFWHLPLQQKKGGAVTQFGRVLYPANHDGG